MIGRSRPIPYRTSLTSSNGGCLPVHAVDFFRATSYFAKSDPTVLTEDAVEELSRSKDRTAKTIPTEENRHDLQLLLRTDQGHQAGSSSSATMSQTCEATSCQLPARFA